MAYEFVRRLSRKQAAQDLREQYHWMAERGYTRAGYIARYAGIYDEQQAAAIQAADQAYMDALAARVGRK